MFWPTLVLCAKVFFCRIMDVSLGTVRTVQIVRGNRKLAALFGFAETFLWFLVVREALTSDIGGVPVAIAYAGGYATGTMVGCLVTEKFIKTKLCVQVVTTSRDDDMIKTIRSKGYGVSVIKVEESEYSEGKYMLYIEIVNTQLSQLRSLIKSLDEKAFIMVHESKAVLNGYFAK